MPRNEIQNRINQLKAEIGQYNNMNIKILAVIEKLNEATGHLDDAFETLKLYYNNDNNPRDEGRIHKVIADINAQKSFLQDTILPASENQITSINENIRNLEIQRDSLPM